MKKITRVAVIGAGTMGAAIAQHFCMKGLDVVLMDLDEAAVARGRKAIEAAFEEAKARKLLDDAGVARVLGCLKLSTRDEDLVDRELVVEAVFEDITVKRELFARLEKSVSSECILATNTSSFQVTDVAEGLARPERVVGVHYFYHAAKNKLVEVIPGRMTPPGLVGALRDFYAFQDKLPIVTQDAPGFAVNRFFVPWLNEGARLLEEGFGSIPFIDEVAREVFGIGMGPFALMNATGVPIAQHAAEGLASKLGRFYAPAGLLKKQVATRKPWDLEDRAIHAGGGENETVVRERLLAASLGVAARMVSEGVADMAATDLGARVGLRWPRGPFEMLRAIGVEQVRGMVSRHFARWDLPWKCPELKIDWIEASVQGDCGFLVFNIPDRMNPLGEEVMRQFSEHLAELEARSELRTIVVAGRGKAFVAGADIKFFLDSMDAGDLDRIQKFTEFGQQVFNRLASSGKRTVAYLNGLTLGGGLELALACQYRVATPKALLAFPETGIGIYPGLGGTQRAPRLVGKGLAKYLIATGQMVDANTALGYGLVDQVIEPVLSLSKLGSLKLERAGRKASGVVEGDAFAGFDGSGAAVAGAEMKAWEKALRRKAPQALRVAMELVDRGEGLELPRALALELAGLKEVFATKDARIGLESVIKKARPEFTGA